MNKYRIIIEFEARDDHRAEQVFVGITEDLEDVSAATLSAAVIDYKEISRT